MQQEREETFEEEAENLVRESKHDTASLPASVTSWPGCSGPQEQSGSPSAVAKEADISFSVSDELVDSEVLFRE